MQDLKYYVLWVKKSPLLKEYLDKYYTKLISNLRELKEINILNKEIENLLKIDNRDFILKGDQASIINLLYNKFILNKEIDIINYNLYLEKLKFEINLLLSWNTDKLLSNKWKKIAWTNIILSELDNNPFNQMEAHPQHKEYWWVIGWWESNENDWLEVYEKTFNLLKEVDEWIYDELNQIITKIVPLGTARWVHNSASYKECIWHLYMWYTLWTDTPEINNLEAIIHESSHNKLNLLMHFDDVILNDKNEKYYSAIRPDARHIYWVFLGYHAFAPTMFIIMKAYKKWYFWDDINWLEKIVLYHIKTKFLQKVVKKYAKLTKLWNEISEEIDYVILKMDILIKELKPSKEVISRAKIKQKQHFEEVNINYPYLEY